MQMNKVKWPCKHTKWSVNSVLHHTVWFWSKKNKKWMMATPHTWVLYLKQCTEIKAPVKITQQSPGWKDWNQNMNVGNDKDDSDGHWSCVQLKV